MKEKRKKILIIMFQILKAQEHEWFAKQIDRNLFDIEFVMINAKDSHLDRFLKNHNYKVYNYTYSGKKSLIPLTFYLFLLMIRKRYDIIHTHLFEANMIGLTAGFFACVPRRIMTRHSGDYHHVYFPKAVKYDRYCNMMATDIIAVSQNISNILINMEGADPQKITLIHHGIDTVDYIYPDNIDERVEILRVKYALPDASPVIGVISRFIEWKGVQFIVPAFARVLQQFPDAILVLANASGTYEKQIKKLLEELPESSYRLIEFENDISALYRNFNCFVHVPISSTAEAFGQTYIEAMAAGVPMVITLSGVALEFAINEKNCIVVDYSNTEQIFQGILRLISDENLRSDLIRNGMSIVREQFSNDFKIQKLTKLYLR